MLSWNVSLAPTNGSLCETNGPQKRASVIKFVTSNNRRMIRNVDFLREKDLVAIGEGPKRCQDAQKNITSAASKKVRALLPGRESATPTVLYGAKNQKRTAHRAKLVN